MKYPKFKGWKRIVENFYMEHESWPDSVANAKSGFLIGDHIVCTYTDRTLAEYNFGK